MDSVEIITKNECFSCRACEQICPTNCICMEEDSEGFLYPHINTTLCTSCGVCLLHCPAHIPLKHLQDYSKLFYGVKLQNKKLLQESSSGGLFGGLAEHILNQGGIVFGAAYDEKLTVHYISVSNMEQLYKLKGSKYVASDTESTFSQVKELLKKGLPVLYTGSPCQIDGLRCFLGREPENLFTADIICHGVPSQKLFDRYIEWLSKRFKEPVLYYGFRDKDVGGWTCGGKTKTKTKTKTVNGAVDPYYSSFMRGETYRHSCYSCPYTSVKKRPADITMGDFWGVEFFYPQFSRKDGVSCCVVNTAKGQKIFDSVKNKFECIEVTEDSICRYNKQLKYPSLRPRKRTLIYEGIDTLPLNTFIAKLHAPYPVRVKRFLISLMPTNAKIFIKRILQNKGKS